MNNVEIKAVNMDYAFKKLGDKRESEFRETEEIEGRFLQCRGACPLEE